MLGFHFGREVGDVPASQMKILSLLGEPGEVRGALGFILIFDILWFGQVQRSIENIIITLQVLHITALRIESLRG